MGNKRYRGDCDEIVTIKNNTYCSTHKMCIRDSLIPVLITKKFDMIYVFVLGVCILGFSCYYENYVKEISQ